MSTRIDRPLIVDLDGTLTPADTLHESLATLIARAPLCALLLPLWLVRGRANFKQEVSARSGVAAETLPYRESLLAYLRTEKAKGRRIVLATAAHRDVAHAVAKYLGIFDLVIASDETRNLRGAAKLDAIFREVGEDFSYAGNSDADLPIWAASGGAIVVGASQGLTDSVRSLAPIEREFPAVGGGPARPLALNAAGE